MENTQHILNSIAETLHLPYQSHQSLSGGDISEVYLLQTKEQAIFVKLNHTPIAEKMFEREREGLEAIAETKTIKVPATFLTGKIGDTAFLAMEFIPSKRPNERNFQQLGTQLAALHQCGHTVFGFEKDNFIGRLPQSNQIHKNWSNFYVAERLFPQFKLAVDQKLLSLHELPKEHQLLSFFDTHFPDVQPSLLHGDLWGGNYLISETGEPYLIDPATYYGDQIVDIAMSKLFGGFGTSFYHAYQAVFPKRKDFEMRIDWYQLYYLLVHLNLFGRGYFGSVNTILRRYFG